MSKKYVFFGTPRFATIVLDALAERGIVPVLIITQPDEPQGRGLVVQPPPAKLWAIEHEVPYLQPKSLRVPSDELDAITNSEWDAALVAAYGNLIPNEMLALPKQGYLNVHPSLLPLYRGAAPIETQIMDGVQTTGVTIIALDSEMDHGPILAQAEVTVSGTPTRTELEELLAHEGGLLLADVLENEQLTPEPQDHARATFTQKLKKSDGLVTLEDGAAAFRKYCALEGSTGTYFFHERRGQKIRVKINEAALVEGIFTPIVVTPEGKRPMQYDDFLRGD